MLLLLGYLSALAASAPDALQLRRTIRIRSVAGLSSYTQFSYLLSWSVWLLYGVRLGDGPLILSAVVSVGVASLMVLLLGRLDALPSLSGMLLTGMVFLSVAAVVWYAPRSGGVVLAAVDIMFFIPQLRESIVRADLSGVSPLAVGWELTACVGWVVYTVLAGIPEAGVYAAVYSAILATVAWRLLLFRRRSAPVSRRSV